MLRIHAIWAKCLSAILVLLAIFAYILYAKIYTGVDQYSGYIDKQFLDRVSRTIDTKKKVILNTTGGKGDYAILVAELFREKGLPIEVIGFCLSSCAEYLLSGSDDITFREEPLIGFHGNFSMSKQLLIDIGRIPKKKCFQNFIDRSNALYNLAGLNTEFWKTVMEVLEPTGVHFPVIHSETLVDKGCFRPNYTLTNKMWFPTSDQLRDLYGLKFKGQVCADNLRKCENRLNNIFKPGQKFLIGDTEIITKDNPAP